jgi:hypothetical protein
MESVAFHHSRKAAALGSGDRVHAVPSGKQGDVELLAN